VAALVDGKPVIIRNKMGLSTTPSVVSFERVDGGEDGEVLIEVGQAALEQAERNPTNTFASVKRLIGRARKEASGAVADASQLKLLVDGDDGSLHLECEALGRSVPPEEISCHVVRTLLEDVERELGGEKVTRAVITVPAYFTDQQRRATEAAGLLAGLERVKLLREPEAAALAYGLDKLADELILVFDLGGGTFDVSVLEVGGGIIEVLWTGGDAFLGGDDFDKVLAASLLKDFLHSSSISSAVSGDDLKRIERNKDLKRLLLNQARAAKTRLSSARSANVVLHNVLPGLHLNATLTQKQFEQTCATLLDLLAVPVRQVALMAGIELQGDDTGVDALAPQRPSALLTGDTGTMSPADLKALKAEQRTGRKNSRSKAKVKAEVHRVQKRIGNTKLRQFPGGRKLTEVVLVGGGTRMAAVPRLLRALTGIEPRRTIDPDEAVALGAAIQAGIMDGSIQGLEVLSPMQAALLRGFARKRLAEEQGTYKALMGDPSLPDDDADDWSEDDDEDWFDLDEDDLDDDDTTLMMPAPSNTTT